jgi:putative FmdB family regulatory protein
MPRYEYECTLCHERFDKKQGFDDKPVANCPHCKGVSQRVFHAVPIVFKGSGFYCTDNSSTHKEMKDTEKKTEPTEKPAAEKANTATENKTTSADKGDNGSSPKKSKKPDSTAKKSSATTK